MSQIYALPPIFYRDIHLQIPKNTHKSYSVLFSETSSINCRRSPAWSSSQLPNDRPHSLPFFISSTSFLTCRSVSTVPAIH